MAYFPPLDQCLAGRERLISWKAAYRALAEAKTSESNATLEQFLTNDEVTGILLDASYFTKQPSPASKGRFETHVAPINVSQSSNGDYDLEEIKADALWLSKELGIEEMVALRIAIVEWQNRPADQLLTAATETANVNTIDFGKPEVRQDRLLKTYLDEKQSLVTIRVELAGQSSIGGKQIGPLGQLAVRIGRDYSQTATISACVDQAERALQMLDNINNWPAVFKQREEMFVPATLIDLAGQLRLLLAILHGPKDTKLIDGQLVLRWFRVMDSYAFLQVIPGPAPLVEIVQCLTSLASLAMLQLPIIISGLRKMVAGKMAAGSTNARYPDLSANTYLKDDSCISHINRIMYKAATSGSFLAGPAIYAWSIFAFTLREATAAEQEREGRLRLEDPASDTEAGASPAQTRERPPHETDVERKWDLFHDHEAADARNDPVTFFAQVAVDDMGVYQMISRFSDLMTDTYGSTTTSSSAVLARSALLELMREGVPMIQYDSEIIEALLAVIGSGSPSLKDQGYPNSNARLFLDDHENLRPSTLDQALLRYPYELSPVLRLCTVLSTAESTNQAGPAEAVQVLEGLTAITLMVPEHFRSYELENEEDNANSIQITADLPVFRPKQDLFSGSQQLISDREMTDSEQAVSSNVITVPAFTSGSVVREDRPMVLQLRHPHSALEYLGLLLATFLPTSKFLPAAAHGGLTHETASEIVVLATALLSASTKQFQGIAEAKFVIERLSYALPEETDFVSIVADIFESELLAHADQAAQPGSLDLVVGCAAFLGLLISVMPERVWAILSRSSLLGLNTGGACALAAVVAGTEVHLGQYRFLVASVQLFSGLVADAIRGLVKRKSFEARRGNRFDSPMRGSDCTPERTINDVLSAFTRILLEASQNFGTWRFESPMEKHTAACDIAKALEQLLHFTYGLEPRPKGLSDGDVEKIWTGRISAVLVPAAEMIMDAYAPEAATSDALIAATVGNLLDGLAEADGISRDQLRSTVIEQIQASSTLLANILRIARSGANPSRAFNLATSLHRHMPTFLALYASDQIWRAQVSDLFSELVQALACTDSDPPSLLAGVDEKSARSISIVVASLDRPMCDVTAAVKIWKFLSAALSSGQQRLAIYLLTGSMPSARSRKSTVHWDAGKATSLLSSALNQLSKVDTLSPELGVAMLQFVATAQGTYVGASETVRSHSDFVKNMLEWIERLQPPSRAANAGDSLHSAREHRMAAYFCEIMSASLHASLDIGDKSLLQMLLPRLKFLTTSGIQVDAYNRSLQRNLAENLAKKFPNCELTDFKRSAASAATYGNSFVYDREIADQVLSHQAFAWNGNVDTRTQGYEAELGRANANLSLVDAQTRLLMSWTKLAATLSEYAEQDPNLPAALITTAVACLRANADANLEVPGAGSLLPIRAGLVFTIMSKLVDIKYSKEEIKGLLRECWNLVRTSPVDFEVATAQEDLDYYRLLLEILFLSIRPHVYMPLTASAKNGQQPGATNAKEGPVALSLETAGILVEIVQKTIAPAFKALCANLHTDLSLALPSDFALITALLQSILAVKGIQLAHTQIAGEVANAYTVRSALSLYSWADQLAEVADHDPVYGEIAISFLLTLSSVPAIAEHIALSGALMQLANANLNNYFRKPGGKGPFDEPARMFDIWTEGILPLCLNLLDAVGAPIASEVASFLNSFPQQLARAQDAFQSTSQNPRSGAVTLGLLHETRNLILLVKIIQKNVAFAAAEGVDASEIPDVEYDLENARAEVEKLARTKRSLADKIVPMNEREWAWARESVKGSADNKLQALVLREITECLELCGGETSA